jgi:uncharacterized protein
MSAERIELSRHECVDLLHRHGIGRLCIIDHGCPVAFPISFRVDGAHDDLRVVVRTAPGTLLGDYEGLASLEVDQIELGAGWAWSVIVRGRVSTVVGAHALPDPEPFVSSGRHRWLVLEPAAISGRRFTLTPASDGFSVEWQVVNSSRTALSDAADAGRG